MSTVWMSLFYYFLKWCVIGKHRALSLDFVMNYRGIPVKGFTVINWVVLNIVGEGFDVFGDHLTRWVVVPYKGFLCT